MLATRFTHLVGCELPIQQAGMGGVAGPDLAVAVSAAGGLGTVALHGAPPVVVAETLDAMRRRTRAPFAYNVLLPFLDRDAVAEAASRCRCIEFFYGDPDAELVRVAHSGGALAAWQVGSRAEAEAARDAGCDIVVVQGVEAGGHVRGRVGLHALLAEVVDAIDVAVVAAGGIGSARSAAAALAAGADAVRLGTRFVATREADTHPVYAAALARARAEDTTVTETFSALWSHAPHRVLQSSIDAVNALDDDIVGELQMGGSPVPIPRFSPSPPTRTTTGTVEAMALYAGESVTDVTAVVPAAEIVREIATGAEELLRRWS